MSALVPAIATIFAPAAGAATAGGILTGVLGTALKAGFVGGIISKATGGSFGKGFLLGGLGGVALGGLGTFGGAAGSAAGSAAGGAAGGGLFSGGFLGNVLAGAAQSWSMGAQMKEEEEQRKRQEERAEDRYSGVGDALSPFNDPQEPVGLDGGLITQSATGGPPTVDERAVDRGVLSAGDQYQRKITMNAQQPRQRARYNPQTRQIEYEERAFT